MDVIIAGAGSIGLLLGSFLSEAGMNVTMFVRRKEQAELIEETGICRINLDRTEKVFTVNATTRMCQLPKAGLWIVAVKYTGLNSMLSEMMTENVSSPVLFIQNGIAHMELAYETDLPHIAFATVEHGALRIDDRTVSHNGIGLLTFAVGKGEATFFNQIEDANSAIFPVKKHADAEHILMRKVLINCMINPLTALLGVKNGELITNKYCNGLFKALYFELINAFKAMEPILPYEVVADVCRNTARNQSSMLADRLAGRPMEIETIVTAVIRKTDNPLPLLSTLEQMLYAINGNEAAQ